MGHLIPFTQKRTERGKRPSLLLKTLRRLTGGALLLFLFFYSGWILFSFFSPPLHPWHKAPVITEPGAEEDPSLEDYLQNQRAYVALIRESVYGEDGDPLHSVFASEENITRNSPYYREPRG